MTEMIHQAQRSFIVGAINVGSSSLQMTGYALATTSYAASTTGLGAQAGVPLAAIENAMKYTGLGVETAMDYRRGNNQKIGYNAFTNTTMGIVGAAARFAPGPTGAYYNLILTPFNVALDYGGSSIQPKKR